MNDEQTIPSGSDGSQADTQPEFWQGARTTLDNGYVVAWKSPIALQTPEFSDEYPVDALPEIIQAAVIEVQADTQAPPALVAASALSVVSTVVQGYVSVERKEGLDGPVSLYLLTFAKSGERKTASDKKFTPVIKQYEDWQRECMKPAVAEYEARQTAWEAAESGYKDALRAATKKGESTERVEQSLGNHMLRKPLEPRIPKILRGDDTPEALAAALEAYPLAAVISAEAGVIFGAHGMNADSVMRNLAQANAIWDGGSIKRGRTTQQSIDIEGMRVTMGLQVQPAVVENFMSKTGALAQGIGFFARFLLCQPESTQGYRFYKETQPGQPALVAFNQRAREILSFPVSIDPSGHLFTTTLQFSEEAKERWVEFYNDVESSLGAGREYYAVQEVASKIAEQAARIAGCFHAFECAPGASISGDHMRSAVNLARWYLQESLRYCKLNTVPEVVRNANAVEEWLVRKRIEKGIMGTSVAQIQRAGPNPVRERPKLDAALELLQAHHRVYVHGMSANSKKVYMSPYVIKEWT